MSGAGTRVAGDDRDMAGSGTEETAEVGIASLLRMHTKVFGTAPEQVIPLKGDASERRMYRLHHGGETCIGVIGPHIPENRAFIGFARRFRAAGLPVPEIFSVDSSERLYLEEDLGDSTLAVWQQSVSQEKVIAMYTRVLETLLRFQIDVADVVDYDLCYQTREFGREAMAFDLRYFREMYLERLVRIPWDRNAFERDGALLIDMLLEADRSYFLYRDFQSRNIMIHDDSPWFIDFQSGRRGALHYDLASLLYDSRGGLFDDDRTLLLGRYLNALEQRFPVDRDVFLHLFDGFALLRLMQALGAFGNIGLNKGKPVYLDLIPSRLATLGAVAARAHILDPIPNLRTLFLTVAADHPSHERSH